MAAGGGSNFLSTGLKMSITNFLSQEDTRKIVNAAIEVLSNTGISTDNKEAADLLLSNGATKRNDRIAIHSRMVRESLDRAQSTFRLYGRDGRSIRLGSGRSYIGPGSDALYQVDQDTGSWRFSTLDDVSKNVRLVDGLHNLEFAMSTALPYGITDHLYVRIFAEMVKNTVKPMAVTMTSVEDFKEIVDIAAIVAGSKEGLSDRPLFLAYVEPRSPLIFDDSSIQRLFYAAENGIPYTYAAGANCGVSAPVKLQGAVVQGTAESLGGLVLGTLKNPNSKFVFGANSAGVNMKTAWVSYGNPAWHVTTGMYASIGDYLNLPSWGTGGATDSVRVDAQAGAESEEGIFMAVMHGTSMVHDAGFYNYGYAYDPKYLVFIDGLVKRARHFEKSLTFNDEDLCMDQIDDVARHPEDGGFIMHEETARHLRESLYQPPDYMNTARIDSGNISVLGEQLAAERARILNEHVVTPLDVSTMNRVNEYMRGL